MDTYKVQINNCWFGIFTEKIHIVTKCELRELLSRVRPGFGVTILEKL